MLGKSSCAARWRAFTLVELLVVIGIIALLIAILMPVLSKVRQSANLTVCGTQLRNIGQAAAVYANDNKNLVPRDDFDAKEYFWPTLFAKQLSNRVLTLAEARDRATVLEFLRKEKIYHCPAMPDWVDLALHYTANNSDIENARWGYPSGGVANDFIRLNRLPDRSSNIVYIAEVSSGNALNNNIGFFDLQYDSHLMFRVDGTASGGPRMIRQDDKRHQQRTPLLFFDGHVELRRHEPGEIPAKLFNPLAAMP